MSFMVHRRRVMRIGFGSGTRVRRAGLFAQKKDDKKQTDAQRKDTQVDRKARRRCRRRHGAAPQRSLVDVGARRRLQGARQQRIRSVHRDDRCVEDSRRQRHALLARRVEEPGSGHVRGRAGEKRQRQGQRQDRPVRSTRGKTSTSAFRWRPRRAQPRPRWPASRARSPSRRAFTTSTSRPRSPDRRRKGRRRRRKCRSSSTR